MSGKILVFGASGFIGKHLCQFLLDKGYSVYGIGHPNNDAATLPFYFRPGEITEEAILDFCPEANIIINCAGGASVAGSFNDPFTDFQKMSNPLYAGLEFIRKFRPGCLFIQTSSAAVYGNQRGLLAENAATDRQVSPYGVHKKISEQICAFYCQQFGLNISILRLFSVYGPGLKKQLLWDACNKINRGEHTFYGTGNEVRDWVHIGDICRLYAGTIELSRHGLFLANGGTGTGTKVCRILELIYRELGLTPRPVFCQSARQGDPNAFIADNSYLKSSIGWQPDVSPQQGITEYVRWFKEIP